MFLYFISSIISKQLGELILDNFKKIKIQNMIFYFKKTLTSVSMMIILLSLMLLYQRHVLRATEQLHYLSVTW